MDSRSDLGGVRSVAAAATLLSGSLFWFGTRLHPIAALTWFAPLPVLLLAPRISGRLRRRQRSLPMHRRRGDGAL
jgi:hypothetical protein